MARSSRRITTTPSTTVRRAACCEVSGSTDTSKRMLSLVRDREYVKVKIQPLPCATF
jgi:hypothetical protein